MTEPSPVPNKVPLAQGLRQLFWRGRWLYLQALLLAAVVWVLWPLQKVSTLPNPPLPAYTPAPPNRQTVLVIPPESLSPNTQGALRAIVYDPDTYKPISGARVELFMPAIQDSHTGEPVYTGETDKQGTVHALYTVPAQGGRYDLVIDVEGEVGHQQVIAPVWVQQQLRLDLITDRTTYLPGQEIGLHLRVLDKMTGLPAAGHPVRLTILDPHDTPIWTKTKQTSDFGLVSAHCTLADLIAEGTYRVRALIVSADGEQPTVMETRIEHSIQVQSLAPGVEPGEILTPSIPVQSNPTLTTTEQSIQVSLRAESGTLAPGIENMVHIQTSYIDGSPALCDLTLHTPTANIALQSNDQGYATWAYTPLAELTNQALTLTVQARDVTGKKGQMSQLLTVDAGKDHLLIRPQHDQAIVGASFAVDVFASKPYRAVYLDVVRDRQTINTYSAPLTNRHVQFQVQPGDVWGILVLRAYALDKDGRFVSDTRTVTIQPSNDLDIAVQTERTSYTVGETALLHTILSHENHPAAGMLTAAVLPASSSSTLPWAFIEADLHTMPGAATPLYTEPISKAVPMPLDIQHQIAQVQTTRQARQDAVSQHLPRLAKAATVLALLGVIVVLASGWRQWLSARLLLRAALSALFVLPLGLLMAILLVYFGRLLLGPGALIALALCWFGALIALLVHGYSPVNGSLQILLALFIGALALGWGINWALQQKAQLDGLHQALLGAALGLILVTLYLLALSKYQDRPSQTMTALGLLLLVMVSTLGVLWTNQPIRAETAQDAAQAMVSTPTPTPTPTPLARSPITMPVTIHSPPLLLPIQPQVQASHWQPDIAVDETGQTVIPLALSSGTWTLQIMASGEQGEIDTAETQVQVIEPLAIEVGLPVALTVGDEFDLPITLRNGTFLSTSVQITVPLEPWFQSKPNGSNVQTVEIEPNAVQTTTVPIRVREWGQHTLNLVIMHKGQTRILSQPVVVQPAGQPMIRVYNRQTNETDTYKLRIPWSALPETDRISIRIFPTWDSVLEHGLDNALAHLNLAPWSTPQVLSPTDRFSTTLTPHWPERALPQIVTESHLLALLRHRLLAQGRLTEQLDAQIAEIATLNVQRLYAWQQEPGGFASFGSPANVWETSEALACLTDLDTLITVDHNLIDQVASWLIQQQDNDGAWRAAQLLPGWDRLSYPELPLTAQTSWALIKAGYGDTAAVKKSLTYLNDTLTRAQDPYSLALGVHALAAWREMETAEKWLEQDEARLDAAATRLAEMGQIEQDQAIWQCTVPIWSGASGAPADAACTALATSALLRTNTSPARTVEGLVGLANQRNAWGIWATPQGTWWALDAFALAADSDSLPGQQNGSAALRISTRPLNSDQINASTQLILPVDLPPDRAGPYVFNFTKLAKGYNDVWIEAEGGPLLYQVVVEYILPWSQVEPPSQNQEAVSLAISYDRTELGTGELIHATVGVILNRFGQSAQIELALGVPPNLEPLWKDWEAMQESGLIAHYAWADGQIRVILDGLAADTPRTLHYRLQAVQTQPSRVSTQPTWALDLTDLSRPTWREPVDFEVQDQP